MILSVRINKTNRIGRNLSIEAISFYCADRYLPTSRFTFSSGLTLSRKSESAREPRSAPLHLRTADPVISDFTFTNDQYVWDT